MVRSIMALICQDEALAVRLWPAEAVNRERQVNLLDGFNGRVSVPVGVDHVLAVIAPNRLPFVVWVDPDATRMA